MIRFAFAFFLVFSVQTAQAAQKSLTFDTSSACLAAKVVYSPTKKAKEYKNLSRLSGTKKVPLEHVGCAQMDTASGKKWGYLPVGTKVLTKDAEPHFLFECRNRIYQMVYEEAPAIAEAVQAPESTCATGACGEVTKVVPVTTIFEHHYKCRYPDGSLKEATMESDQAVCPTVVVKNPVTITVPTQCQNCGQQTPSVAASNVCVGVTCFPSLATTRQNTRTDHRCVLEVKDREKVYFLRFGQQDGGHLSVLVANDRNGDYSPKPLATMVGDGTGTVKLSQPFSCDAAIQAFSAPAVLNWTAKRLNFSQCVPVGKI